MNNEKNYWGIDIVEEILNPNYNQNNEDSEELNKAFDDWSLIESDKPQIELYYQFLVSTGRVIEDDDFSIIELNNVEMPKTSELCKR